MLKNAFILVLFLLSFCTAKAQYLGGNGDGYAMSETNNVVLGLDEKTALNSSVIIYPNPANINNGFTVFFHSQADWKWIEMYDVTGKLQYKNMLRNSLDQQINPSASDLKSGVYILMLKKSDRRSAQHKIVLTD